MYRTSVQCFRIDLCFDISISYYFVCGAGANLKALQHLFAFKTYFDNT